MHCTHTNRLICNVQQAQHNAMIAKKMKAAATITATNWVKTVKSRRQGDSLNWDISSWTSRHFCINEHTKSEVKSPCFVNAFGLQATAHIIMLKCIARWNRATCGDGFYSCFFFVTKFIQSKLIRSHFKMVSNIGQNRQRSSIDRNQ